MSLTDKIINEAREPKDLEGFNNELHRLVDEYISMGCQIDVYLRHFFSLELSVIKAPPDKRNQGIASSFMNKLTELADKHEIIITLSPSNTFGSSVTRLKEFYQRFGFKKNTGSKADHRFSNSMIRVPKGAIMTEKIKKQMKSVLWETFNKKAKEHFGNYDIVTFIDFGRQYLVLMDGDTQIAEGSLETQNFDGYRCICTAEVNENFRKQGIYSEVLSFFNKYVKSKGSKGICSLPSDPEGAGIERSNEATNVWLNLERKGLATSVEEEDEEFEDGLPRKTFFMK